MTVEAVDLTIAAADGNPRAHATSGPSNAGTSVVGVIGGRAGLVGRPHTYTFLNADEHSAAAAWSSK
jgi:hypothetical protein